MKRAGRYVDVGGRKFECRVMSVLGRCNCKCFSWALTGSAVIFCAKYPGDCISLRGYQLETNRKILRISIDASTGGDVTREIDGEGSSWGSSV
ncbi:hypothetical protein GOP47_0005027 [Adiantum capillus-veneris]|uniref:Uncharacterized protein n=1 Tax=Adiantum capillus-veneris TaxID=13818 RepID=A0A9D4V5G5_ADICA|nr:hypothetical protein GOP47_0005027 [Adiantum capillus-veneris]